MKKKIEIEFEEFDSLNQLDQEDQDLISLSMHASENAYSPYSGFSVGAALRLRSGRTITGNNRENAAFPSGSCAEDTAISFSGANFPDDPVASIAISAQREGKFTDLPVSPCGNCRQIIAEEEDKNNSPIRIILYGEKKIELLEGIGTLLPLRFGKDKLKG